MRALSGILSVATILATASMPALAGDTPAPADASVYIVSPSHGETVSNPVRVVFGLRGMGVAPAGVAKENTGHHHLLIDTGLPPQDESIPADDNHRHFGGGQTEVDLTLPAGRHTLQLLLADENHIPHNPVVSSPAITITVE